MSALPESTYATSDLIRTGDTKFNMTSTRWKSAPTRPMPHHAFTRHQDSEGVPLEHLAC
eukprot:CAMPEP_0185905860 /NCGR_PEP_ID=MMETSP0196C-20130402/5025_1 /TAXON_ID=2932 /ORGANISM="Alexandrium fundyense, Strain CCMP1719" /LENGTH=58 /DNA_ID=CAMNT_0028625479 /DNA_START=13 /DNA_END=186 /DNA_ORIENTATION=-